MLTESAPTAGVIVPDGVLPERDCIAPCALPAGGQDEIKPL